MDALNACYEAGIVGKYYRLLYLMNSNTKIEVKTNVGLTEIEETGENVGQGTNEGALISASNIDGGIFESFKESDKEIRYGSEDLKPLMFQDDILRASDVLESLHYGNDLVNHDEQ